MQIRMKFWKVLCGRRRLRAVYTRFGYAQLFCGTDISVPCFAVWFSWGVPNKEE